MAKIERLEKTDDFKVVGTRPLRPDGIDKVTGRALYGADLYAPGMLVGAVLRSPHPHARIKAIDTAKAAALAGVKAVITKDDFATVPDSHLPTMTNVMALDKALYEGHAVAAVAAIDASIAAQALALIAVDYEILPHVTDVDAAMAPDAPLVQADNITEKTKIIENFDFFVWKILDRFIVYSSGGLIPVISGDVDLFYSFSI